MVTSEGELSSWLSRSLLSVSSHGGRNNELSAQGTGPSNLQDEEEEGSKPWGGVITQGQGAVLGAGTGVGGDPACPGEGSGSSNALMAKVQAWFQPCFPIRLSLPLLCASENGLGYRPTTAHVMDIYLESCFLVIAGDRMRCRGWARCPDGLQVVWGHRNRGLPFTWHVEGASARQGSGGRPGPGATVQCKLDPGRAGGPIALLRRAPLVSLAHQGAPSDARAPGGTLEGGTAGTGSSLTHAEREGGAHEGVLGEAGLLLSVLLPGALNQPAGASWPGLDALWQLPGGNPCADLLRCLDAVTEHTGYVHTCAHSPSSNSMAPHPHIHTPVPTTWETWGWGQPQASMLDPSRNPGEIPGTNHLAACLKPRTLKDLRQVLWAAGSRWSWAWPCALHALPRPRDVEATALRALQLPEPHLYGWDLSRPPSLWTQCPHQETEKRVVTGSLGPGQVAAESHPCPQLFTLLPASAQGAGPGVGPQEDLPGGHRAGATSRGSRVQGAPLLLVSGLLNPPPVGLGSHRRGKRSFGGDLTSPPRPGACFIYRYSLLPPRGLAGLAQGGSPRPRLAAARRPGRRAAEAAQTQISMAVASTVCPLLLSRRPSVLPGDPAWLGHGHREDDGPGPDGARGAGRNSYRSNGLGASRPSGPAASGQFPGGLARAVRGPALQLGRELMLEEVEDLLGRLAALRLQRQEPLKHTQRRLCEAAPLPRQPPQAAPLPGHELEEGVSARHRLPREAAGEHAEDEHAKGPHPWARPAWHASVAGSRKVPLTRFKRRPTRRVMPKLAGQLHAAALAAEEQHVLRLDRQAQVLHAALHRVLGEPHLRRNDVQQVPSGRSSVSKTTWKTLIMKGLEKRLFVMLTSRRKFFSLVFALVHKLQRRLRACALVGYQIDLPIGALAQLPVKFLLLGDVTRGPRAEGQCGHPALGQEWGGSGSGQPMLISLGWGLGKPQQGAWAPSRFSLSARPWSFGGVGESLRPLAVFRGGVLTVPQGGRCLLNTEVVSTFPGWGAPRFPGCLWILNVVGGIPVLPGCGGLLSSGHRQQLGGSPSAAGGLRRRGYKQRGPAVLDPAAWPRLWLRLPLALCLVLGPGPGCSPGLRSTVASRFRLPACSCLPGSALEKL
ncbi:hypothetical protein Cadr_000030207 [Camelus dromedarius]|uniref:Uncharacterized protein n=1 Tax=Camelus dromedarius TaxID=9838 RepID=A0A5N4C068_CAMDR|nr:hypothetical protein Cadr_000030207 [Camelus dromedarius]